MTLRTLASAALPPALIVLAGCASPSSQRLDAVTPAPMQASSWTTVPVMSLSGRVLAPPAVIADRERLEADLAAAQAARDATPEDPEAWIWLGRRLGYLWRYREAIAVFDAGAARWPADARFLRHRGHRWLSVREFARAQADLERAAALVAGQPDAIEPDGAPNAAGIPRTTLAYNIHYHLGLAQFLQGDFAAAAAAFGAALAVSRNDDARVAAIDWRWMALMRQGRADEAAALLAGITADMDLLENHAYHRRLRLYRGELAPDALLDEAADPVTVATQGFGVGHWFLVQGDRARARAVFERVLAGDSWNAFGYLAAEAELARWR